MNIAIGASPVCYARGGTERVAAAMSKELAHRGHTVHLFAYDHGRPPVFPIDPRVRLNLVPGSFGTGAFPEIMKVRQYLTANKMDVFLSLQSEWTHMLWALSCLGTGTPFICSERSDPRFSEAVSWNRPGRMAVLASADAIHELVDTHLETIPDIFRHKAFVIPNAAPHCGWRADLADSPAENSILFLARFIPGKRADLLIKAFALVAGAWAAWRLCLAGYGPEEENLRNLCADLGITERVDFVASPESWEAECARAKIYCLPTRVEGFPNSVLEAMACGLPVVGIADCPAMTGIIEHGVNGFLAAQATPEALVRELQTLMASADTRKKIAARALEDCDGVYKAANVWDQWERRLREVAARRGATVMDSFAAEPFASMATLSSAARREYLYRNFNEPMPGSWPFYKSRIKNFICNLGFLVQHHCGTAARKLANALHSGWEAFNLARKDSWRNLQYYYLQIEKTRRMKAARGDKRTRAFGSYLASQVVLKDKKVLCVGCGSAKELNFFRELGADPVGIDLHAGEKGILSMNMENMDFPKDAFDVVYSCHSFEHSENQASAAAEFARVVRPGGYIAIEVPVNVSPSKVDLHTCASRNAIHSIFAPHIAKVIAEEFLSLHDRRNMEGGDVYRFIYQIGE